MTKPQELLAGRYRLDHPLARGRGSTTWMAWDVEQDRACVVKELSVGDVVRDGSSDYSWDEDDFTKLIDLFEREARVLAHLDHPGIPAFIDHFSVDTDGDRRLYTVQEFVEGDTLQKLVEGGRHFTEDEAVHVAREVTELLGFLHGRSPPLIHRDVKPSNVILAPDGRLHLVDFGSVRNLVEPGTVEGRTIVGTYGYMPMEQYEGRAVPQSDFYALGMTLVHLLSHRDPTTIPRKGMALDFRAYTSVSERFARTIEWMIAPDPEERPPSADAIRQTLDSKLRRLPDLHRPRVPESDEAPGAVSTTRRLLVLLTAIAALLAGFIGFIANGLPFLEAPDASDAPVGAAMTEAPEAAPPSSPAPPDGRPVVARNGELRIDVDRGFQYRATGFAMGRAVHHTALPAPYRDPPDGLRLPAAGSRDALADAWFGVIPMDEGTSTTHYALSRRDGGWVLLVDRNRNMDLTDDGPPHGNEGSGTILAASVPLTVTVGTGAEARTRPYDIWIWFDEGSGQGPPRARFYPRHHYAGSVTIGEGTWNATVFAQARHDGSYREEGVCIDLDGNGECFEDAELFHHGDQVVAPEGTATLVLDYR